MFPIREKGRSLLDSVSRTRMALRERFSKLFAENIGSAVYLSDVNNSGALATWTLVRKTVLAVLARTT